MYWIYGFSRGLSTASFMICKAKVKHVLGISNHLRMMIPMEGSDIHADAIAQG